AGDAIVERRNSGIDHLPRVLLALVDGGHGVSSRLGERRLKEQVARPRSQHDWGQQPAHTKQERPCLFHHYRAISMLTLAKPAFSIPSLRAAARDRSMMRCSRLAGPLSLILTVTLRPLLRCVTFTFVPNGRDGCAAVMA